MKILAISLLFAATMFAQTQHIPQGALERESEAFGDIGYQVIPKLDSATVNYLCGAPSQRPTAKLLTVSAITLANPGVATITGHGFSQYATPLVYITGGTGDWAAVNGLRILTYVNANTMSIGVDTSAFAAFGAQVLVVSTMAVAETDEFWGIKKVILDASGNTVWSGWASSAPSSVTNGNPNLGGRPKYSFACASRSTYGFQ